MSAGEWKSGGREEVAEETVTAMLSRSLEASVRISARPGAKETSIRDQLIFPLGDNDGILAEKWDWECKQSNGAASRNERLIGVDEASIPEEFKVYTGVRQSPVAIDSTVALPWMFPPLQLHHHWEKKASIKLTNTGHSVEMSFVADDGCCPSSAMPYLIGGPLAAEYEFVQMHFHWGNENHVGCEHIIDNKKYAMEAHLVHYNRSYGSVAEAFKHPDGLAVIGIFLQLDSVNVIPVLRVVRTTVEFSRLSP